MQFSNILDLLGISILDLISYAGLAACGTMSVGLMLGMLLGSKYDPVISWPHRNIPLFRIHNWLAYTTIIIAFVHPALLLLAPKEGFGLLEILVPVFSPKQPLENTFGALALYSTIVIVITSYLRKRMTFKRWKTIHYLNYLTLATFLLHSLLTNPNLDGKEINYTDGGKIFVILCVIGVLLAVAVRAFYAGRASRSGVSTAIAVRDSAQRWEGRLKVVKTFVETGAVRTFRLMAPEGGKLPFNWKAGQYLTLSLETPTGPIKRAYTIASSPNQTRFVEITVKREAQGVGSTFLHDHIDAGSFLDVLGPAGSFTFSGPEAPGIVLIAGGVGITPMMSKIRNLTEQAWEHPVWLIYAVQKFDQVIFVNELAILRERHPNFHILIVPTEVSDPAWSGPKGFLTENIIKEFVPDILTQRIHICGPTPMMNAVLAILHKLEVPDDQVFTESFGAVPVDTSPDAAEEVQLVFKRSNRSVIAKRGESIVRVAEANGIAIDYSCRSGECGSCQCKVLEGDVKMPKGTSLSDKDIAKGEILACVARPVSNRVVLDL